MLKQRARENKNTKRLRQTPYKSHASEAEENHLTHARRGNSGTGEKTNERNATEALNNPRCAMQKAYLLVCLGCFPYVNTRILDK